MSSFSVKRNSPSARTSIILEVKALRGKVDKLDSIDLNDLSQTKMCRLRVSPHAPARLPSHTRRAPRTGS